LWSCAAVSFSPCAAAELYCGALVGGTSQTNDKSQNDKRQKDESEAPTAKKTVGQSAATSSQRALLKSKQLRRQSVAAKRKSALNDQASRMSVAVDAGEPDTKQAIPYLFWPSLPLAMMKIWLGAGEPARK
jgi:hypothetical protein